MPPAPQRLDDLAAAVLDGVAVDWDAAESSADPDERPFVAGLRLVASVAGIPRDAPPPVPARWGHLHLVELIGRGAFGEVFRAWDPRLDREVALKLLPAAPACGPDTETQVIREGRLLAKVRHPNVVTIYGAEQIGGRIGLWMELVRGRTLEDVLAGGTAFGTAEALDIGLEVCRAVAAVHAAGLLHRDIKAQNVALAEDGRIVLMDFGAGRDLAEASIADLAGTPLYLAPEILAGHAASVRSDLYSIGVLLYHLLTGSFPVPRRSLQELRRSHEQGSRVLLSDLRRDLPRRVVSAVERALEKDPQARYASAHEMERALTAVRDGLARKPRSRVAIAAAAALAAALTLLVRGGALHQLQGASPSERGNWIQITRFGDPVRAPALSPDGRMLAFIRGSIPFSGPGEIYVKELPDGPPEQLTNDDLRKDDPVFSPDGTQIAYTTVEPNTLKWDTRIIAFRGTAAPRSLINASGLTWIGQGRFLFSEIKKGVHMALVTATEGVAGSRDIYVPPHERGMVHRSALSPDGRWVLAAEMENQLWLPCRLLPFDGKDRGKPVGPPGAPCIQAAWSPDGRWMFLNSSAGGFHIWRQRFPDGVPEQLTMGPTEEHGIAVAPDGRSLISSVGIRTSTLWVHDDGGARQVSTEGNASLPGRSRRAHSSGGAVDAPPDRSVSDPTNLQRGGGEPAGFLQFAADPRQAATRARRSSRTTAPKAARHNLQPRDRRALIPVSRSWPHRPT